MLSEVIPDLLAEGEAVERRPEGVESPSLFAPMWPGATAKPSATAVAPTTSRMDLRNMFLVCCFRYFFVDTVVTCEEAGKVWTNSFG